MNKNIKYRFASLIVLVIVLAPINPLMSPGQLIRADPNSYLEAKDGTNSAFTTVQNLQSVDNVTKTMGAYIPDTLRLEDMNGMDQRLAISKFLEQGFDEYYFIMDNFMDIEEVQLTERLLD